MAYSATMVAVKQIEQAYKSVKNSGAAIERSLRLSKLMDAATAQSPNFSEKMQKLQARLQTAQVDFKRLYQETLDKMSGGDTSPPTSKADADSNKNPGD